MKKILGIFITLSFLSAPVSYIHAYYANPNVALVLYVSPSCNYYLVEDANYTYEIIKWIAGRSVMVGDMIEVNSGSLYGYNNLYFIDDTQNKTGTTGYVSFYNLNSDQAVQDYISVCNPVQRYVAPTPTPVTPIKYNNAYYNEYTANPDSANIPTYTPTTSYTDSTYVNTYGNTVYSPSYTNYGNSTATCGDGTYSYSQSKSGTCSHHGGVSSWSY